MDQLLAKDVTNKVDQVGYIVAGDNTKRRKKYKDFNDLKPSDIPAEELSDFNHEIGERTMDQTLNNGINSDSALNNMKVKNMRVHILAQNVANKVDHVSGLETGDNTKKVKKYKEVNDLRSSMIPAVELSVDHETDKADRKEIITKKKSKSQNETEQVFSSHRLYGEEIPCSENRTIDNGNILGSVKDERKHRKKRENYNSCERSLTCTDKCNVDEDKKQNKKRKMKDYFIESENDVGRLKENVKEASDNVDMVITKGDTLEMSLPIQKVKKHKKREIKDDLTNCPGYAREVVMKRLNNKEDCISNGLDKCELNEDTKKRKKKVSFTNKNEVIMLPKTARDKSSSNHLVWGRFSPEEDELIKKAIADYIEENQLGEQGLHMILNCQKYKKQVKKCWDAIGSALPWRSHISTYLRAHSIYERGSRQKWKPEEYELLKRCYAQHGPAWTKFSEIFGRSKSQVKNSYRRIKPVNLRRGNWGWDEYQSLFDLVNLELQMKAYEVKETGHRLFKDNISWDSISNKLSTRGPQACCLKWYYQLTSSMIKEGQWTDIDDYKMIDVIQKLDPSCFEDVDWDNLLEHRSGDVCRKRWHEMIRYIDRFWAIPFIELVDILSQRYYREMIPYREKSLNTNPEPSKDKGSLVMIKDKGIKEELGEI